MIICDLYSNFMIFETDHFITWIMETFGHMAFPLFQRIISQNNPWMEVGGRTIIIHY